MTEIKYSGEESPRFVKFAGICLENNIPLRVKVIGREPLTSRPVQLEGKVKTAVAEGYIQYLIMTEDDSDIEYWIAGSNATRSIAAKEVSFNLDDESLHSLKFVARSQNIFIFGINIDIDETYKYLEKCMLTKNVENLRLLLNQLETVTDYQLLYEIAASLRTFANIITSKRTLQLDTEKRLQKVYDSIDNIDTRIRIVENIGYFGTERSIDFLGNLLNSQSENDHVRWAAAIALGRIQGESIEEKLIAGQNTNHEWTNAAILLGLSRRATNTNKDKLEPIFDKYLSSNSSPLLKRYACLGISRFDNITDDTYISLRDIIGDPITSTDVRGYAALALSSGVQSYNGEQQQQLDRLLESLTKEDYLKIEKPEDIWGIELLAELATIMELNETAAKFHRILSDFFDNWRSQYHNSLYFYALAEAAVHQGEYDAAFNHFEKSLECLNVEQLPDDAKYSLSFRRDIVKARLLLHEEIQRWNHLIDTSELSLLVDALREIGKIYARYTQPPRRESIKQLSTRELIYIRCIKKLVEILSLIVRLDIEIRTYREGSNSWKALLSDIAEGLQKLSEEFNEKYSHTLNEFIADGLKRTHGLIEYFEKSNIQEVDKFRSLRTLIAELKQLARKATWPMPARACPISGLGKGTLRVICNDTVSGNGSQERPFLYQKGEKSILDIAVEIEEMAPGGSTKALLECNALGKIWTVPIHAVEGVSQAQLVLDECVSSVTATQLNVALKFEARDCSQTTFNLNLFVRYKG
jgi:hypothetical protein